LASSLFFSAALGKSEAQNPSGIPLSSAKDWPLQRSRLKQQWQTVLGKFPAIKPPLDAKTVSTEELDGFYRSLIRYQVEENVSTDGYLLLPKTEGPLPAVLVF